MVWAWNATNQSGKTRSFNSQKRLVRRRVSKTLTNACRTIQVTRNGFRCLTKSLLTRYHVLRHLKLTKSFRLEFASNVWRKGDELLAVCVSPCWGYATWSSIDLLNDILGLGRKSRQTLLESINSHLLLTLYELEDCYFSLLLVVWPTEWSLGSLEWLVCL